MKNKMENMRNWIEEHKVEIGIGTLCVATTVVCGILIKKQLDPEVIMNNIKKANQPKKMSVWPKKLDIVDLGVGALDDAMVYDNGVVELWMDQIPLSDMGALGESLRDHFPELSDASVWALMSINPNKEPIG